MPTNSEKPSRPYYEIKNDALIVVEPIAGSNFVHEQEILTKEVFVKCYKEWIEKEEKEVSYDR